MLFETVFSISLLIAIGSAVPASITPLTSAPPRARHLTSGQTSVSPQMAPVTELPSQTLFDDFNYSNYKQLAKHG